MPDSTDNQSDKDSLPADANRREFYRVKDRGLIEFYPIEISDQSRNLEEYFPDNPLSNLLQQLQHIDKQNRVLLQSIAEHNAEVIGYLKGIDKKIDLLAQFLSIPSQTDLDNNLTEIDYGEGGISFITDKVLKADSFIAIKITFLSNFTIIKTLARVLCCQPQTGNKYYTDSKYYRVSSEFHQLTETQRQLIAQQVIKVQQAERRAKS